MLAFKDKKIYFIGIKGVGLTMLAQFLARSGNQVSGSDTAEIFLTDAVLRREKIPVRSPFAAANLPDRPDLIVYSSAYTAANNPELAYIRNQPHLFRGVPLLKYGAALGSVFNHYQGIAICGSHGKTTTSAWLGYVLDKAGFSPNVLVGSRVPQFKSSGLAGRSRLFIAEVDEYQDKLQYFQPHGVVLNNIDYDHPDFFKTRAAYTAVFRRFIKKIPRQGFLVINGADEEIGKIKRSCPGKIISYALAGDSGLIRLGQAVSQATSLVDYLAEDFRRVGDYQSFTVKVAGRFWGKFKIRLSGRHNIANALAVIAVARRLGVSRAAIRRHLAGFRGTERRGQILGHYRRALIMDDYAHHPTEIKATLAGLKERYPRRRLIVVFHPHTFSRTRTLFADFVKSFSLADKLIILDIYASAREKRGGVSSRELVGKIVAHNRRERISQEALYLPAQRQAEKYLRQHLQAGDILVLMGAGDVFRLGQALLA
jgi:UDP-N-acetylmuramate--alanine ligase